MGDNSEGGCSTVGICIVILALGSYCGYVGGEYVQRKVAVKAGVAWYEVDPKTGETRFVYGQSGATR